MVLIFDDRNSKRGNYNENIVRYNKLILLLKVTFILCYL